MRWGNVGLIYISDKSRGRFQRVNCTIPPLSSRQTTAITIHHFQPVSNITLFINGIELTLTMMATRPAMPYGGKSSSALPDTVKALFQDPIVI